MMLEAIKFVPNALDLSPTSTPILLGNSIVSLSRYRGRIMVGLSHPSIIPENVYFKKYNKIENGVLWLSGLGWAEVDFHE